MLILTSKIQAQVRREQSPVWVIFFGNNDQTTGKPLPWLGKATFFKLYQAQSDEKQGSEGSKPGISISTGHRFQK